MILLKQRDFSELFVDGYGYLRKHLSFFLSAFFQLPFLFLLASFALQFAGQYLGDTHLAQYGTVLILGVLFGYIGGVLFQLLPVAAMHLEKQEIPLTVGNVVVFVKQNIGRIITMTLWYLLIAIPLIFALVLVLLLSLITLVGPIIIVGAWLAFNQIFIMRYFESDKPSFWTAFGDAFRILFKDFWVNSFVVSLLYMCFTLGVFIFIAVLGIVFFIFSGLGSAIMDSIEASAAPDLAIEQMLNEGAGFGIGISLIIVSLYILVYFLSLGVNLSGNLLYINSVSNKNTEDIRRENEGLSVEEAHREKENSWIN